MGSLVGTSNAVLREPFLPLQNSTHIPFGDLEALKMIMASCDFSGDRVAAVVIEPIQGEGGINVAAPGYLPPPASSAMNTAGCWSSMKSNAGWVGRARCSTANTKASSPT